MGDNRHLPFYNLLEPCCSWRVGPDPVWSDVESRKPQPGAPTEPESFPGLIPAPSMGTHLATASKCLKKPQPKHLWAHNSPTPAPSLGLPLLKLLYHREFSKFAQGLLTCVALQWCQDGANTSPCLCQVVIEGQCPAWAVQLLTGTHWQRC